jgi:hypothetical protein
MVLTMMMFDDRAPIMKWALVIAGISDFTRPAEKLSVSQNVALTCTGLIWTRWCLIIKPKNYLCVVPLPYLSFIFFFFSFLFFFHFPLLFWLFFLFSFYFSFPPPSHPAT